MQSERHNALSELSKLGSWIHPERLPAGLEALSKSQQNRWLCHQYRVALPPFAEIVSPNSHMLMVIWPQLARLCLMTGSLGYTGAICAMRLQPRYQPGDLAFVTSLSHQCCPVPAGLPAGGVNISLLCCRGWDACCQALVLSASIKQLGALALPPNDKAGAPLAPLFVSCRISQTINGIINYLLEDHHYE